VAKLSSQALDLDSIKKRHYKLQVCSAITGEGLADGMEWFISDISSRIFLY
jgi:ADP-ribosylation factor-like protein 2